MVEIIKDLAETCVDKITATEGKELQISAYLTDPDQIDMVLEGFLYGSAGLNSGYVPERNEQYLRLTCSFRGKLRDDVVAIGKAPRINNSNGGFFGDGQ